MRTGGPRENYYRVSIPGKEAFTIDSQPSTDRALTHIDISMSSLSDILRIVENIKNEQGD
jgi:hypothetical protein